MEKQNEKPKTRGSREHWFFNLWVHTGIFIKIISAIALLIMAAFFATWEDM